MSTASPSLILGSSRPRLLTLPLEADPDGFPVRTRGHSLIRFAQDFGEPFWPHQEELALRGLELYESGHYRARIVIVLMGRQNGKTRFLRLLGLWRLLDQGAGLVVAAGQDRSQAFAVWEDAVEALSSHATLGDRLGKVWRRTNDEYFRVLDEDGKPAGRYRIKAATRSSGRGPSAELVLLDELREQTDTAGWAALSKTIMARVDGQIWAFSNAGDRDSVVLNHLRAVALDGSDPSIMLLEYSGENGCDLDDRQAWADSNPSLGQPGGITEPAIRTAMYSDPPEIFRTEVLCQHVPVMAGAVDDIAWGACADSTLDSPRSDWVLCVDVAPDGEHVSAVLAAVLDDGRVRIAPAGAWESTKHAPATELARRELPGLLAEIKPRKIAWWPSGPAKMLAPVLRPPDMTETEKKRRVEIKGLMVGEACMGFSDLVAARRIVHPDDPLMTTQVVGAERLPEGDGWRFTRSGAAHCDTAYAAAGAAHVALTHPVPKKRRARIIAPNS